MARIAITGALGYLGCAATAAFRRNGHDVVGIDTGESGSLEAVGDVVVIDADVTHPPAVRAALDVVEPAAIVHLAGIPDVERCEELPVQAARVNVEGTRTVASWAHEATVPVVFASTAGVYGPGTQMPLRPARHRRPAHFYGHTKRAAEDLLAGLATEAAPAVALEMTNLYGQYDVAGETVEKRTAANFFAEQGRAGEPIPVHRPGWQARDFVHVLDAADAFLRAAERLLDGTNGLTFARLLVGGDDEWTIAEVANHVAGLTGAPVELVDNPGNGPFYDRFAVDIRPTFEWCGWAPERSLEDLLGAAVRA